MSNRQQFCTFYLENYYFGIELLSVQEVLRELELSEVPLASHAVRGLMNLRGQIVIAVDLRRRLGLQERSEGAAAMNVIVRAGEDAVSLLVDEIGDVVEAGEDSFEPPPETLRGAVRSAIRGVHKLEKQLMHVLDTDWACAVEGQPAPADSSSWLGEAR